MGIKIVLADDHALVREGVRQYLAAEKSWTISGEADNSEDTVRICRELQPDLVILDVMMPGDNGPETAIKIIAGCTGTKILALSGSDDSLTVKEMLEAGASGYILKTAPREELLSAVREVLKGGLYFSREILKTMVQEYTGRTPAPAAGLTEKEKNIVQMIAEGKNTKEIAYELELSTKSIEVYRSQIMEKLGLNSIADLVKYALRNGLARL